MRYSIYILLAVTVASCITKKEITAQPTTNLPIANTYAPDTEAEEMIAPYTAGLQKAMNKVIGSSSAFVEKSKPSSALGNFMADAIQHIALKENPSIDACVLNYGGIRSTIDSGDIHLGDIYQLMPFDNEIVLLELTKEQLDTVKSIIVKKGGEPFSKELLNLKDKPIYTIVVNDYIANGGDNYSIFKRVTNRTNTGILLRDALIEYVQSQGTIIYDYNPREL